MNKSYKGVDTTCSPNRLLKAFNMRGQSKAKSRPEKKAYPSYRWAVD